jgi:outer membrane protein assembly factor BamB
MKRLLIALSIFLIGSSLTFAEWPQWRGPDRTGEAAGELWPQSLEGLEPMWKVSLGKGYPGPILGGDRLFVVETIDKKTVGVRALDRTSGEPLWSHQWEGSGKVPFFASANGDWVRSTPVWDGETLFVGDMNEKLVALNGEDGSPRWVVDFPKSYETKGPDFGFASSPLVDGDALYVQAANSILRLNKKDGEVVWRALDGSGDMQSSGAFSSPVIAELAGVRQLIVLTRLAMHGVALESGAILWSQPVPHFRGMNIMTPLIHGDRIFTSPYRNGSFLFELTRSEESGWAVEEIWKNPASGYMSSPIWIGDSIYMHLGNGRLSCINAGTGEERWRTGSFGKYWSLAWHGDKILALDSDGELLLVQTSDEAFQLLGREEVADAESWAHIAVSEGQVYVRDLTSIRAFRWDSAKPENEAPASPDANPAP